MEESLPPSILETPAPPATSLFSRLTNVFIAPTEVFDEVQRSQPTPVNWIVPLVLAMIAGVIYTFVIFSQPNVIHQMKEAQEKKFQAMVASGKVSQAQADQMIAATDKFMNPGFMKIMGSLGSVVANAGILFLSALIFWAIGKRAFHGNFSYMKSVEAIGLAMMINVLGAIVAMLLAVIYGNLLATPGPALLVSPLDAANKLHRALSALNVISIWYIGVVSIGLARLSGVSFWKAAAWIYGIWAVLTFSPILFFGGK